MKCERCGMYEATTHLQTLVNGAMSEKNLCDFCATAEGISVSPQNGLAGMLASMLGGVLEETPQSLKKCPVCGTTFEKIAQSGKMGCTDCYNTFKSQLLPYLKRVHGSTKHIGKIPKSVVNTESINELRKDLNRLVSEEKYEEAAVIRDKIKKLEGKDNG